MIECPKCKSLNDENNQFCGKCGEKLPDPKYCPQGHQSSYTDDFCTKCGTKLVSKEEFERISNKIGNLMHQAREFKDNSEFDKAINCWDEILNFRPDYEIAMSEKMRIYRDLGKFEEAIECCDKRIEINSRDNFAYLFKGNYLSELGKFDEAIECYDKSILLDPYYHSPYIDKGKSLLELNKLDEALKSFDKGLKLTDDVLYWHIVVNNLFRFSKFKEVIDYCNRGLELYPDDFDLNKEKAIDLYIKGEKIESKNIISKIRLKCSYFFYTIANIYNNLKEFDKALKYCEKSINLDSKYVHSWGLMGEIYFNLKQYDESLRCCKKALELTDEDKEDFVNHFDKDCQEFVKNNFEFN